MRTADLGQWVQQRVSVRHVPLSETYSRQCGPGFFPSATSLSRCINSPQVVLQVAQKSVIDAQPVWVNLRILESALFSISQVNVVPFHSGCSPWHLNTTRWPGSNFTTSIR